MPRDIVEVCREWRDYWGHHNEGRLRAFADQTATEIVALRERVKIRDEQITQLRNALEYAQRQAS